MKGLLFAGAALTLGGCDQIPGSDANVISEAEAKVAAELTQYAGLEFGASRRFPEADAVCGGVRVRKPDGDMTRYRRFLVVGPDVHLEPITDDIADDIGVFAHDADFAVFDTRWQVNCENP